MEGLLILMLLGGAGLLGWVWLQHLRIQDLEAFCDELHHERIVAAGRQWVAKNREGGA